jgi:thiol-disulfide isomerase/thioredoxin
MNKIAFFLSILAPMFSLAQAQEQIVESSKVVVVEGIAFNHDTWGNILKKAKAENKMIFMDCYTSWCGPCKVLAKTVFKDPKVAVLMNEKFINVKVDMEKGEGVDLKAKFEVKAFPTLLFFSPKGEVEHRIVGSVPSDTFIKEANLALSGKGLNSYQQKYRMGVRDTTFLKEYIQITNASYLKEEAKAASLEYFTIVGLQQMLSSDGWEIFKENINDTYSVPFLYFWDSRPLFIEKFGLKEVNQKANTAWNTYARSFAKMSGNKCLFDEVGFNKYIGYMKAKDVKNIEDVKFYALVDIYGNLGNWTGYADLIDARIKTIDDIGLMMLYNYPMRVDQKCADATVRKRGLKWVELGILRASEKESGKMWLDSLLKLKKSLSEPYSPKK